MDNDLTQTLPGADLAENPRSCWRTPGFLFEKLAGEFDFTIDVAADEDNALCPRFFTREDNAMARPWGTGEVAFFNPPYCGAKYGEYDLASWEEKAFIESQNGNTVVALFPSDTSTLWFLRASTRAKEIRLIAPRIGFVAPPGADVNSSGNRGGSVVIVYGPRPSNFPTHIYTWDLRAEVEAEKARIKASRDNLRGRAS